MSAWGIGATTATRRGVGVKRAGADSATVEPAVPSIDTLVTWIPGEVIAFYAAIVLVLQPGASVAGGPAPFKVTSLGWLVLGFILACAITWLGGWSKVKKLESPARNELIARMILAGVAFLIWSFVIPGSWWYSIARITDNQVIVPILVGVFGSAFALLAEGIVRRIGPVSQ
jgi:hypothetical protein